MNLMVKKQIWQGNYIEKYIKEKYIKQIDDTRELQKKTADKGQV